MSVLFFTIFVSLMLAIFFVGGFLYHHDFSGGDPLRDSLLPFGKEVVRSQKLSPTGGTAAGEGAGAGHLAKPALSARPAKKS